MKRVSLFLLGFLIVSLFLPLYQTQKVQAQKETIVYTASTETHYLADGQVWKVLYSGVMFAQNSTGHWVNASEVLKITKQSDDLTFHYDGIEGYFNITFEAGVFYNGVYYSMQQVKELTDTQFDFPIKKYRANRKYAVNITNITLDKNKIENITLTYKDHYGFTLDQFKSEKGRIVAKKIMELVFDDLKENNFTVAINMSQKRIYIGNLTDKFVGDSLYLDPTIKLQDAETENFEDTYIAEDVADTNYGTLDVMRLEGSTSGYNKYGLIKFNISSVPSSQQIDDAMFYAYMSYEGIDFGEEYHTDAHHLYNQTWLETYPTWNNQANLGSYNATYESRWTVTGGDPVPDAPNWVNWSVTNMVAKDYGDTNDNCSIWIRTVHSAGDPQGDFINLRSKEYTDTSLRPYLNITYSSVGEEENLFGEVNPQFTISHLNSWTFNRYGTVNPTFTITTLTLASAIKNFYGEVTQILFEYSFPTHEITWSFNRFGQIMQTWLIEHGKSWSFDIYGVANPLFTVESVTEFIAGAIENFYGEILQQITITTVKTVAFTLNPSVNPLFTIQGLFTTPNIINIAGIISLSLNILAHSSIVLPVEYATKGFVLATIVLLAFIVLPLMFILWRRKK